MAHGEEVGEEYQYPYPSHVFVANFVTVKLTGRQMYGVWKTQMLCLLKSHDMLGFINGDLKVPTQNSVLGWERSDELVKGWILGSLSEQTLTYVVNLVNANDRFISKDVWDKLHAIYDPTSVQAASERNELEATDHQELYEATLLQNVEDIRYVLSTSKVSVTDKISINGDTALHIAVGTTKKREFLEMMLDLVKEDDLLDMRNSEGSTVLHVASIVGNTEAAKILMEKNPQLLFAKDKEDQTPIARALSNMHTDTYFFLMGETNRDLEMELASLEKLASDELLVNAISSKDIVSVEKLLESYAKPHLESDAVLMALAQNFPSELNKWDMIVYNKLYRLSRLNNDIDIHYFEKKFKPPESCFLDTCYVGVKYASTGIIMLYLLILRILAWLFKSVVMKCDRYNRTIYIVYCLCLLIPSNKSKYYTNPILKATRQNAHEFVQIIGNYFPDAIWSTNEDGHNIIQYAVTNRSEKVYNLLYQMSEHKNIYKTINDSLGNNLLHLAATLAPTNKLKLISGAALQTQRELQWFQEVEKFVCPLNIAQKNSFDETPQMVFTREHKKLVVEGEKWMKTTAESYTITAALITTIMFAAAITVPGGNTQETGIPIFTDNVGFSIFAVSNAVSMFTSVTSLLMFLSILTARFAEQDFLFKLPTKLVIGLVTLFISTTAMIIAFGATVFLVFGRNQSWIIIPIALLTLLPITSFVTLQFPLVWEFVNSTYGCSIFGKKSDDPFY